MRWIMMDLFCKPIDEADRIDDWFYFTGDSLRLHADHRRLGGRRAVQPMP
jgi:hypothetical protein